MAPYFETVKSFADVPITPDGVDTASFLEASDGLVNMLGLLGVGIFTFLEKDLRDNIGGVRSRHQSHVHSSVTLEMLVINEAKEGSRQSTACLVRLIRGMMFTWQALVNMQQDRSSELRACFKRSYDTTLKHHHGWLIQSAVTVAMRAVPNRVEFYKRISQGGSQDDLDAALEKWLLGLGGIVSRIKNFLLDGGHGTV